MLRIFSLLGLLVICGACSTSDEVHELKSPCVAVNLSQGTEATTPLPCVRRPVNPSWLQG